MSLSQDPVFSLLKDDFVCGYKDIEGKSYAGASGKHKVGGQAVDTTNGAGPHNIQMFILSSDGTVLTCLPGYWHSQDLATEIKLAQQLNDVWHDQSISIEQKDAIFRQMHLAHISQHSKAMQNRSRMQGFDIQYEIKNRLYSSDVFYDPRMVDPMAKKAPPQAVKTTDVIMHERMAMRPFEPYEKFDVAQYSDYGKPFYDKKEDSRMANGQVAPGAKNGAIIGNDPRAHPVEQGVEKASRAGLSSFLRYGLRAAMYAR